MVEPSIEVGGLGYDFSAISIPMPAALGPDGVQIRKPSRGENSYSTTNLTLQFTQYA